MSNEQNLTPEMKEVRKNSFSRGHTHEKKPKANIEQIIKDIDEAIDEQKERKSLLDKQGELMMKFPKPMEPKWEYETKEEWVEVLKATHKLELAKRRMEMDMNIKGFIDRKAVMMQMLDDEDDAGDWDKGSLEKMENYAKELDKERQAAKKEKVRLEEKKDG